MGGRKILVALDTSSLAERGVEHARDLADALGADLLLYCAVDGPVRNGLDEFAEAEDLTLDNAADTYLQRVAARLTEDGENVSVEHEDSSDAAASIVAKASQAGANLIVMTTHGRTGLGRQLMGSVTERVLRTTSVPVYVVPPNRG